MRYVSPADSEIDQKIGNRTEYIVQHRRYDIDRTRGVMREKQHCWSADPVAVEVEHDIPIHSARRHRQAVDVIAVSEISGSGLKSVEVPHRARSSVG